MEPPCCACSCKRINKVFIFLNWLVLIRSFDECFQSKHRLIGISIADDGQGAGLHAMMALAVVCSLDSALFARLDGSTGELADGAATASIHIADDERQCARVGEMEGIGDALALQDGAKVMLRLVEGDDGLFVGGLRRRLGVSDKVGRNLALSAAVVARGEKAHSQY